jgi:UDP-N-acetyl-D-glucosamine dehydrogenase
LSEESHASDLKTYWNEKLKSKTVRIGVIGLGYVGLPLAVEFAKDGFHVTGFDLDRKKIDTINRGVTYIKDVKDDDVKEVVDMGYLKATDDFSHLQEIDAVSICVPTPLRKTKDPDISYVVAAVESVQKYLHRGQLVVLESTTYPGTTEELLLPRLEEKGLKVGEDFFIAFSPERVNPGDTQYFTKNTPKVIGGMTPSCSEIAKNLYEQVIDTVVAVSSPRVAEMVKLLENTFRSVNIGMVNELALMCDKLEIDVWEVIDAAATKPFGFMPFYPGPGLGGHCIPIDPFYLSWKAKTVGFEARFIELAGQVNSSMPYYVVSKIINALNDKTKPVKGSKIIILGVTYKRDVDDLRESPSLDIIGFLERKGAHVDYFDPYVPEFEHRGIFYKSVEKSAFNGYDCAVLVTDHSNFDHDYFLDNFPLIVDTRNFFKNYDSPKIVKL